jgi:hypothetical protein
MSAPFVILVIEVEEDWQDILNKKLQHNENIQVFQSTWCDLDVGPCNNFQYPLQKRCPVTLNSTWKKSVATKQSPEIKIYPDLVVFRNESTTAHQDYRGKLLAFVFSEVPCMNSSRSVLAMSERPTMMATLSAAARKIFLEYDDESFKMNLVEQEFFSNHATASYSRCYPAVVKFGSAHAGGGKAKVESRNAMDDMRSILPMTKAEYAFAEPFPRRTRPPFTKNRQRQLPRLQKKVDKPKRLENKRQLVHRRGSRRTCRRTLQSLDGRLPKRIRRHRHFDTRRFG